MKEPTTKQTPKRTRRDSSWKKPFLKTLAQSMNVMLSCKAAAVTRASAYAERHRSTVFRKQWDQAIKEALELLEASAWQRASRGIMEPIWMKDEDGKPVKVDQVPKYSDVLLMFLLKAHNPAKYRETFRQEISGPEGAPIEVTQTPTISQERIDQALLWRADRLRSKVGSNGGNGHSQS